MPQIRKMELGQNEEYDKAIASLMKMGINPVKQLGNLFQSVEKNNVDSFVIKLNHLLTYMTQDRNKGIGKKEEAYICKEDVIKVVKDYQKLLGRDIQSGFMKQRCELLEELSTMTTRKTNIALKTDTFLYSIGYDKLLQECTMLDSFWITEGHTRINAAEHVLLHNQAIFRNSPQLMLGRLAFIRAKRESTTLEKKEFNYIMKQPRGKFARHYGIKDEQLAEKYPLPVTEGKTEQEVKREIKELIEGSKETNKSQEYRSKMKLEIEERKQEGGAENGGIFTHDAEISRD